MTAIDFRRMFASSLGAVVFGFVCIAAAAPQAAGAVIALV